MCITVLHAEKILNSYISKYADMLTQDKYGKGKRTLEEGKGVYLFITFL